MQPTMRIPLRLAHRVLSGTVLPVRSLHASAITAANVAPVVGTGPPPEAPIQRTPNERVERRRKHAEMLKMAKAIRSANDGKQSPSPSSSADGGGRDLSPTRRRFWKDVRVKEVDGALQVLLDARPLRHPNNKEIVRVPLSKPTLATALAIEWDLLTSAQQATQQHLIPLTSLSVMRYLDTDSLLCWAPPAGKLDLRNDAGESLRDVQKRAAEETVGFLATHVWPGVTVKPVLDGHSIFPAEQDEGVRDVVQGWVMGLSAWELAGLERAVLAGKSLVTAARFIAEWSDDAAGLSKAVARETRFSAEEAARVTSLEVDWQTSHWGEVDDTHDVNREDVRRQLGSVILLVSGASKSS
ncbi:Protein atp12 [Beauveria bassiana D1-5]|uniref:Protein atp12 n=1 Tax=Beauveria bassiana D1-5 TaxID=1245745 RepID=A0A0A2WAM1_BEABA|nr:Protein atp12 [Beauveria bassiana D1-5]